ncbi:agaA33 [Symbiodinium necroappetens]|uniref:AgaA33 protein n=1 Tax=Symbiodinium necroappetens TaxID=1628268 RepID=A0A813B8P6_9DINO|nr:agaA33 [Symbiodinium necroappetens]
MASGNQSSRRLSAYSGVAGLEPNSSSATNFTDPGFLCQQASQFRVDVLQLLLLGPSRLPGATCVSGQTCVIDLVDSFLLMDTCAVSASSLGGQADRSASLASWGPSALVGAGGIYRLCWCRNDAMLQKGLANLQLDLHQSDVSSHSRGLCQRLKLPPRSDSPAVFSQDAAEQ